MSNLQMAKAPQFSQSTLECVFPKLKIRCRRFSESSRSSNEPAKTKISTARLGRSKQMIIEWKDSLAFDMTVIRRRR